MLTHSYRSSSGQPGLTLAGKFLVGTLILTLLLGGLALIVPESVIAPVRLLAGRIVPGRTDVASSVPPRVDLPVGAPAGPELRYLLWAWNAQMGLLFANGGERTVPGSLMDEHGVRLSLIRQDDVAQMQAELVAFARAFARGEAEPREGAHFVAIMGDGAAAFLAGLEPELARVCDTCGPRIVGSAGYSYGEDKLMGPRAWRANAQAARGSLVATVLRDGDWNIVVKWAADNAIPINPDERSWDPEAINFVNADSYVDAGEKYLAGPGRNTGLCEPRRHKKTGKMVEVCVNAVSTWTPVDVNIARKKGGLVTIVSTREYSFQMPNVIIGIDGWMQRNRATVEGMLAAICAGGDQVKSSQEALGRAATIAAAVYREEDAAYWRKYYPGVVETDRQGQLVELGGSRVSNLADNLHLFGLSPGADNLMARTYSTFGDIVVRYYPDVIASYPPAERAIDTSYLAALRRALPREAAAPAEVARFAADAPVRQVVSTRAYQVRFVTGSAGILPGSERELDQLLNDAAIAGGLAVQVIGHTDSAGSYDGNMRLSDERAWAVKRWLMQRSPTNFPEERLKVFARGQTEPAGDNQTEEGRARNRRVEVRLVAQL